jgi:hypothetical protein
METGFALTFLSSHTWRVGQYSGNAVVHEESFGSDDNVLDWIKARYSLTEAQNNVIQQHLTRKLSIIGPILAPLLKG